MDHLSDLPERQPTATPAADLDGRGADRPAATSSPEQGRRPDGAQLERPSPQQPPRPGMRVIAHALGKGGSAKTSGVLTCGAALGSLGFRVLAVDLDPQGMLGANLGGVTVSADSSVGAALGTDLSFADIKVPHVQPGVDLIGAHRGALDAAAVRMSAEPIDGLHWLHDELAALADAYDYCLVDTPPGLGNLTRSALVAADTLLVPLPPEPLAYLGLADLLDVAAKVANRQNPDLRLLGLVLQMYDPRLLVTRSLLEQIEQDGLPVLHTTIPRSTRVPDASGMGLPVTVAFPDSAVAQAYVSLARELAELLPVHASTTTPS